MARNKATQVLSLEKSTKLTKGRLAYQLNRNGSPTGEPIHRELKFIGRYKPARHNLDII